jgi:hypothetical protein
LSAKALKYNLSDQEPIIIMVPDGWAWKPFSLEECVTAQKVITVIIVRQCIGTKIVAEAASEKDNLF